MRATRSNEEASRVVQMPAQTRILATAGIIGPVLFTVAVLVQQFYRRGGYHPTAQLISDLTAGPYGWVQQLNFVVFGLLIIAFAAGLQWGVRSTRTKVLGPALLGFNGVGLVLAGGFPLREDAAGHIYDPIGVHTVNGVIFFLSIGIALAVASPRLRADPRWRDLATYPLVTGIALLIGFLVVVAFALPAGAPLHDWLGLVQRLVLTVWLVCIVGLAGRLRRIATQTGR
jgi:hypothetical membrane protein